MPASTPPRRVAERLAALAGLQLGDLVRRARRSRAAALSRPQRSPGRSAPSPAAASTAPATAASTSAGAGDRDAADQRIVTGVAHLERLGRAGRPGPVEQERRGRAASVLHRSTPSGRPSEPTLTSTTRPAATVRPRHGVQVPCCARTCCAAEVQCTPSRARRAEIGRGRTRVRATRHVGRARQRGVSAAAPFCRWTVKPARRCRRGRARRGRRRRVRDGGWTNAAISARPRPRSARRRR